MITINGTIFHENPGSCGTCPFFNNGKTSLFPGTKRGFCIIFEETHHTWINPPKRCQKLFNKAFQYPDGSNLVIVVNEE